MRKEGCLESSLRATINHGEAASSLYCPSLSLEHCPENPWSSCSTESSGTVALVYMVLLPGSLGTDSKGVPILIYHLDFSFTERKDRNFTLVKAACTCYVTLSLHVSMTYNFEADRKYFIARIY